MTRHLPAPAAVARCLAVAAVVGGAARDARAAPPDHDVHAPPVVVRATGACPSAAAVEAVLAGLVASADPRLDAVAADVADRGDTYVVAVGERSKTYDDPARDCAERARVAATFVAIAVTPESPPVPPPPPPPPPPPVPRPPPPPVPSLPWWVSVALEATVDDAPSAGSVAPGVGLGVSAGRRWLGLHLDCGWVSGASTSAGALGGRVVIERFPCAVGPTLRAVPSPWLEADLTAALVAGVLRARGEDFAASYEVARLEVGARVSLDVALRPGGREGGIAPVLGVQATFDPVDYELAVVPRGVVAHTPAVWVGAAAGVRWGSP